MIKQYEGYLVEDTGNIISLHNEKLKSQIVSNSGYKMVQLQINKERKQFYVHRLIAKLFVPNPLALPCVNHIDRNKFNNSANNLEWVDYSANEIHKCVTTKGFLFANRYGVEYGPYKSVKEAIASLGISGTYNSLSSSISKCIKGENKTCQGYLWYRKSLKI